jgi:hypothetical protein
MFNLVTIKSGFRTVRGKYASTYADQSRIRAGFRAMALMSSF